METIKAIEEFLTAWKVEAIKYYIDLKNEYNERKTFKPEITSENLRLVKNFNFKPQYSEERIAEILSSELSRGEESDYQRRINSVLMDKWKSQYGKGTMQLVMYHTEEQIVKEVEKDVISRYKALVKKVEAKAGKIIDAGNLYFGYDAGINGVIIGEKATVTVTTIYAGGYNIQQLHYRVLVK